MKKLILPLILILMLLLSFDLIGICIDYTSQYPPAHSDTYVKATTAGAGLYEPYFATDPALSLIGGRQTTTWRSSANTNQRFHIDLGSAEYIRRIYYENFHHSGTETDVGVQNFTFWGSNSPSSFAELTYATDTGWTQLTIAQSTFDEHVALDQADPKYIVVTNTMEYRYYAFKFADGYDGGGVMGLRHVVLQTEDGWTPPYTSQYPTAHSDTYVKSTTKSHTDYWAYYATDPALSLIGFWSENAWRASTDTNQRFHIDLGSAKYIRRIYYENAHSYGANTDHGTNNFTFWGSNTGAGSFDDLVYANDEGWTELTVSQNTFDIHISADQADPKYIVVTNITAYRYYAFKFADSHSGYSMALRRVELQTEDGWLPHTSQYPPAQSDTYVKSTTKYDTNYWAYFATDPALSLTGSASANSWRAGSSVNTNQRFHIDLGSAKTIRKIYYENGHHTGSWETMGVQNFTFWGSNTAASFAELTYATDTGWTQITTAQGTFDIHVEADQADPKYIVVTNITAYRYYAFKFADNYGYVDMGLRRVELQTEDGWTPEINVIFFSPAF